MNSTELYILAGDAICEWGKNHNCPCILTWDGSSIICCKVPEDRKQHNNPLYISSYEIENGMKQNRWSSIGSALHNLFCKELTCQAHQKH